MVNNMTNMEQMKNVELNDEQLNEVSGGLRWIVTGPLPKPMIPVIKPCKPTNYKERLLRILKKYW